MWRKEGRGGVSGYNAKVNSFSMHLPVFIYQFLQDKTLHLQEKTTSVPCLHFNCILPAYVKFSKQQLKNTSCPHYLITIYTYKLCPLHTNLRGEGGVLSSPIPEERGVANGAASLLTTRMEVSLKKEAGDGLYCSCASTTETYTHARTHIIRHVWSVTHINPDKYYYCYTQALKCFVFSCRYYIGIGMIDISSNDSLRVLHL